MAEGNGVDLGSVYGLLREVAATVSRQEAVLERHGAMLEQLTRVVQNHDERLRSIEANMATKGELAELRQTVAGYHASVMGQGILTSELEGRVRRIETHLDLPPFVHG